MKTIKTIEKIQNETKIWVENYKEFLITTNTSAKSYNMKDYIIRVFLSDNTEYERARAFVKYIEDIEDVEEYISLILDNAKLYI